MKKYDIAVVGAGPVGSTFARQVADKGFDVVMLEKKREIGIPLQCAGLLGQKIREINVLPDEYVLNQVYGAYLYSPSNDMMKVGKEDVQAYVIDRVGYDKYLANLAVDSGAELLMNHKVTDSDFKGCLKTKESEIRADIIVGADGHSSKISNMFNEKPRSFMAAQYLIETEEEVFDPENVHLHVNDSISPGFLWTIPVTSSKARLGLFADMNYTELKNILTKFMATEPLLKNAKIIQKYQGYIPKYDPKKKVVSDRTIILGDAASQVKPTTGGGLLIGFECAKMAAECVSKAFEMEDFSYLNEYENQTRKRFKNELRVQIEVQKIFESMNNQDLDEMFSKLKQGNAEELISKYGDMDTQSTLIKEMIKNGLLFSIVPKLLTRRIMGLWK
jgi:digeranylgeranylglycerophospholipid reductase